MTNIIDFGMHGRLGEDPFLVCRNFPGYGAVNGARTITYCLKKRMQKNRFQYLLFNFTNAN